MSDAITAFSERDINDRERLEDYAIHEVVETKSGLNLQIAMVCDGAGGGEKGELAARLTARSILDYLSIAEGTDIPRLLTRAVEEANRVVFSEVGGSASSTVAMVAINMNDDDSQYGRMFTASVGNSRIYLVRHGNLVRLNTDHTLVNEYAIAGARDEAREMAKQPDAQQLMRAIGVSPEVNVDVGFYAERGKDFVSAPRAFQLGTMGLVLEAGDTIITATDGLFEINPADSKPYLRDDEILRYAMDNDVERATKSLMRFATDRQPQDNTAMSMVFVPSRDRAAVRAPLSARQKRFIGLGAFLALALILALFLLLLQTNEAREAAENEIAAANAEAESIRAAVATQDARATEIASSQALSRGELLYTVPGQVGFQFFLNREAGDPVLPGNAYDDAQINYLSIFGEITENFTNPGDFFLQPETRMFLANVEDTRGEESIDLNLDPEGDLFARARLFENGGVTVNLSQMEDIIFFAETDCIAARQLPANPNVANDTDKVAFTCFTGQDGDCDYLLRNSDDELESFEMPIGSRVLIDVDNVEHIEDGAIRFDEVATYHETVRLLTGSEDDATCLVPVLDGFDNDGVTFVDDLCPQERGTAAERGCPFEDEDGDGYNSRTGDDLCPLEGFDELEPGEYLDEVGCPAEGIDTDNDGIPDGVDRCPTEGVRRNVDEFGCLNTDSDGDGVPDNEDLCPNTDPNGTRIDANGCPDADLDGFIDPEDACPTSFGEDFDGCPDQDEDGIPDRLDDCPSEAGDVENNGCPLDEDEDGVADSQDICLAGDDNLDLDEDGIPDACDDSDDDGVFDDVDDCPLEGDEGNGVDEDGCPIELSDFDDDGILDEDDLCPLEGDEGNGVDEDGCPIPEATPTPVEANDSDGDGVPNDLDQCPGTPPGAFVGANGCADTDDDGITDNVDDCPTEAGDAENNGCPLPDSDGDGVLDEDDLCPNTPGGPNAVNGCPDTDGDGVPDVADACPNDPGPAGTAGCPDADNDGIGDSTDQCPGTPGGATVNNVGCHDADGDGLFNNQDACDNTPPGEISTIIPAGEPNAGCSDVDQDGISDVAPDGSADPAPDQCLGTPAGALVDATGCIIDNDNDGVDDNNDLCDNSTNGPVNQVYGDPTALGCFDPDNDNVSNEPLDSTGAIPDICPATDPAFANQVNEEGCADPDGDGVFNPNDACPGTPGGTTVKENGCPFNDFDGDGITDDVDSCPLLGGTVDTNQFVGTTTTRNTNYGCPTVGPIADSDGDGDPDNVDTDDDGDGWQDEFDIAVPGRVTCTDVPTCTTGDSCFAGMPGDYSAGDDDLNYDFPLEDADPSDPREPDACDTDRDGDGVPNASDLCDGSPDGQDADGDDIPNGCDPDDDNDGVPDAIDSCTTDDGTSASTIDLDGDGIAASCDTDTDGDGIPDTTDTDDDNDGVPDGSDVCLGPDSYDLDGDGIPNNCDDDDDNDDLPDSVDRDDDSNGINEFTQFLCTVTLVGGVYPLDPCRFGNPGDSDSDGVPDAQDICPGGDDSIDLDSDGTPDACELSYDPSLDWDSDGDFYCDTTVSVVNVFDLINNDPTLFYYYEWIFRFNGNNLAYCSFYLDGNDDNANDQFSSNDLFDPTVYTLPRQCGTADWEYNPSSLFCDPDDDGDGIPDAIDICNGGDDTINTDGDLIPDACDTDNDNDGVTDGLDVCPGGNDNADLDGDGIPNDCDPDMDGDQLPDVGYMVWLVADPCPADPNPACTVPDPADDIGTGLSLDFDNDGIEDGVDNCPLLPGPESNDGCPTVTLEPLEDDADGDLIPDANDMCPNQPGPLSARGCPDADGDRITDSRDACPNDAGPAALNGCPDSDGDGVTDANDICAAGADNVDVDRDGVPDACDACQVLPGAPPSGCPDSDFDGVPDTEDRCSGANDAIDQNNNGVPDGCETGVPPPVDSDGDGVPDSQDVCPGGNDRNDIDGDGVPDACDICSIGDDRIDTDGDGTPDACDPTPNGDDDDNDVD